MFSDVSVPTPILWALKKKKNTVTTLTLNAINLLKSVVGFARRHPRFKTIGIILIAANEIRGLVTMVVDRLPKRDPARLARK